MFRTFSGQSDVREATQLIFHTVGPFLCFVKTWSSLVDAGALESLPPKPRKRQEAIFELILTEGTFLSSMQMVIQTWFQGLQTLLEPEVYSVICANLEDILLWSTVGTFFLFLFNYVKSHRRQHTVILVRTGR